MSNSGLYPAIDRLNQNLELSGGMNSGHLQNQRRLNFLERAKLRNAKDAGFLHIWAADIIGQRLSATNRTFEIPALLFNGPFSRSIEETLNCGANSTRAKFFRVGFPESDSEILSLQPESIDLAIAILDLHCIHNLPEMLLQINLALKPDGLLMAALPLAGTLEELRLALFQAELEFSGGAASRVDHFPEIRQLGDLLHKTGFKLPVADVEKTVIRYSDLQGLVGDLRSAGASSTSAGLPINRKVWQRAIDLLEQNGSAGDGKFDISVRLGFLSGWKAHQSQQTALKPGAAKHSLKDFL